jgi:Beta propeller domain
MKRGERRITSMMGLRRRIAFAGAAALLVLTAGAATAQAKPGRLVAFHSCAELASYARSETTRLVGPYGLGAGGGITGAPLPATTRATAPQQGVDYSGTNVQEEGVDEPDLVKTDGETLFALANGRLESVDVRGAKPRLLDTLGVDAGAQELLLYGKRLLVLSRGGSWIEPLPALARRLVPWQPAQSVVTEVDVSDPKALKVTKKLTLDGGYVAARLVGRSARIVVSSQVPHVLPFVRPAGSTQADLADATQRNRAVVAAAPVSTWLPTYTAGGKTRPLVQCDRVRRPASFSGLGMLTVLTVDLSKGLDPVDSTALMTDGRIVYASPDNLYVTTERWADRPDPASPTKVVGSVTTAIHRFDISDPLKTQYRGSGTVSGFLLSQWSLSEYKGVLRVVSTETPAWWGAGGDSESFLTTLRPGGDALVQAGRVGELGRGDRVYAVRFVGDTGYVVTFKQVDPLYTLDLADPARPRVLGELSIPGYSAYLHPIGADLLLGVGQDVDAGGRPQGTQLSLFDVSDLRHPTRLAHATLGLGWSEAESDHHAFLYWPKTGLAVLPFDQKAVGFRVSRKGIERVGTAAHSGSAPIRRSVVVGPSLLTVSDGGVLSSSLGTLAAEGWAAFPALEPVPVPVPGGAPGPPTVR